MQQLKTVVMVGFVSAVCAAATACAPGPSGAPAQEAPLARAAGACRIATVDGSVLTEADAAELAAQLSPPPSRAEAGRLAVDAALAQWLVRGYIAPASAARRLASYRELLTRLGAQTASAGATARKALAVLGRAAERVGVTAGPCLEPLALPAELALPAIGDAELAALREPPRTQERRLAERAHGRPLLRPVVWRLWPRPERLELGPVLADELEPELARALAATAPGAPTPAVTTRTGIYFAEPRS